MLVILNQILVTIDSVFRLYNALMLNPTPKLPPAVIAALWSYDPGELDPAKHKQLIIGAVLNHGTKAATDWLFSFYGLEEVEHAARSLAAGSWDKRSLALWSLVLELDPKPRVARFA